jgi:hypothetical protein
METESKRTAMKTATIIAPILLFAAGCDFALQPPNETMELVLESHTDVTGKVVSEKLRDCMLTVVVSYADDVSDFCENDSYRACFFGSPVSREIKVEHQDRPEDLYTFLAHEYIHALLMCLGHGQDSAHKNPVYWTCIGSVEWVTAEKLGSDRLNSKYKTVCSPGTQPENYRAPTILAD